MRKIIPLILIAVLLSAASFETKTGKGYFKDSEGHIVSKYDLPKGTHNISDGFTAHDTASLDGIEIYVKPKTSDEVDERLIQNEMDDLKRAEAIISLKGKGKLPNNFKDKKPKKNNDA